MNVNLQDPGGSGEYTFEPAEFRFQQGETVTFVLNAQTEFHTFTVDDLGIDVAVNGGTTQRLTFTFDNAGMFSLICIPHEALGMVGTIIVSGSPAPAAPAPAAPAAPPSPPTASNPTTTLDVAISDVAPLDDPITRIFILATLFADAVDMSEEAKSLELADATYYEIVERREGELIVLQRPRDEWGKDGEVDRIRFIEVGDEASRRAMVLTGEADMSFLAPAP